MSDTRSNAADSTKAAPHSAASGIAGRIVRSGLRSLGGFTIGGLCGLVLASIIVYIAQRAATRRQVEPFDSSVWKLGVFHDVSDSQPISRTRFVHALVEEGLIQGLTRDAVLDLLGDPDEVGSKPPTYPRARPPRTVDWKTEDVFWWCLQRTGYPIGIKESGYFTPWLMVEFDETSHALGALEVRVEYRSEPR
ncbi:MAG: hypothetical protein JNJ88_09955 [Planctomycetes bacterium]|nr:hypothetical protein [Planctomycetota bacterium]